MSAIGSGTCEKIAVKFSPFSSTVRPSSPPNTTFPHITQSHQSTAFQNVFPHGSSRQTYLPSPFPIKHISDPDVAGAAVKLQNALGAIQLAKTTESSPPTPLCTVEVDSSEQPTSFEETSSSGSSETSGSSSDSGSELDSSSGSEANTSDDSTSSDSDGDVTGKEKGKSVVSLAAESSKSSTAVESHSSESPSEKKATNFLPSDTPPTPRQAQSKSYSKESWRLVSALAPQDPDPPKASDKHALVKTPAHNRSVTMIRALPPELTGGWGNEPTPAPWDWQGMPFDYMGILEEQRRTVYYELHERDGQEEWVLKDYKKGDSSQAGY